MWCDPRSRRREHDIEGVYETQVLGVLGEDGSEDGTYTQGAGDTECLGPRLRRDCPSAKSGGYPVSPEAGISD